MLFIRWFLLFVFLFSCKEEKISSVEEKKFRIQLIQAIKSMNKHYKKTTKKLEKSKNPEIIVNILKGHLKRITPISQNMLFLEFKQPQFFDYQENNPPNASKILRHSVEQFSLIMRKLFTKYKKNIAFVKIYQRVFNRGVDKEQTLNKIYLNIIQKKKDNYQKIIKELSKDKNNFSSKKSIKMLKKFLSSVQRDEQKLKRLSMKYPYILKNKGRHFESQLRLIKKFSLSISSSLEELIQKTTVSDELKKISSELRQTLVN